MMIHMWSRLQSGIKIVSLMMVMGAIAFTSTAQEQTPGQNQQLNQPSSQQRYFDRISANDVALLMQELGIQTVLSPVTLGQQRFVVAQSPGGGRFNIGFLGCENPAALQNCASIILRTAISNAGVSLADLNRYNLNALLVKAANSEQNNLIVFVRLAVVAGGTGSNQLKNQTAIFLEDMDKYVSSVGSAVSVSHGDNERAQEPQSKIDGYFSQKSNKAGKSLYKVDAGLINAGVYNTYTSRFMTEEAKGYLFLK